MSRCCEYILLNKTPVKCMECFFTHSFTVSQFVLVKELENKLLFWHHYSLDLNHLNHTIMVTEQLTVILFGSKHLILTLFGPKQITSSFFLPKPLASTLFGPIQFISTLVGATELISTCVRPKKLISTCLVQIADFHVIWS